MIENSLYDMAYKIHNMSDMKIDDQNLYQINELINYEKFIEWLKKQNIEHDTEQILKDWKFMKIEILSELGSAIWGKSSGYKIRSVQDIQITKAIQYLNN